MKSYFSLVRFSHTIFAMPFALAGFFIAIARQEAGMEWYKLVLVVLCMVFARNAAMGFNRWLDRDIDAVNPRTKAREIPAGIIRAESALIFVIANCLLFVGATWFINALCFFLSPVALFVVLGYSYTKRFTWLCHVILGLGLALAPVGAYLAVTGKFDWIPVLYGLAVMLWTAGFDVIYSLQDEDFDKSQRLHSMPAFFGVRTALRLSEVMHLFSAALMLLAGYLLHEQVSATGWLAWLGTAIFLGMLIYQHLLVKPNDLSKVNMAFATTNGFASLMFGALTILDLLF